MTSGVLDTAGLAARHLLTVDDLGAEGIERVLRVAGSFAEVGRRANPKVPALRGRTVATLFLEDSTRTRLSFETAARRLSADVVSFSASSSSLNKGESLRDTVATIEAMGVDALVVRHRASGTAHRVAAWAPGVAVVNAGDGWHQHPTQALADLYTVADALHRPGEDPLACFAGLSVAVVGDVRHSRVARSLVAAYAAVGARVTLVAPPTLLPPSLEGWPIAGASSDLDEVLEGARVVSLLRLQAERGSGAYVPSLREYTARWGLTVERAARLDPTALVLHPGPVVRGVEVASEVADLPCARIGAQVRNGLVVRMAVLFLLLGHDTGSAGAGEHVAGGADA
ncbi:MAG: aspartate carbamoyltransferase catalytic subunit [Acidimicrobiales bacterium]